jgi:hypothetical protein
MSKIKLEDFLSSYAVDGVIRLRKLGLMLFSLDLPYFVNDSRIYRFASMRSESEGQEW